MLETSGRFALYGNVGKEQGDTSWLTNLNLAEAAAIRLPQETLAPAMADLVAVVDQALQHLPGTEEHLVEYGAQEAAGVDDKR